MSAELAERRLVHKADLVCPHVAMPAHVTGTVVVAIVIGKTGDVIYPKLISGPAMLRKPVLDAVRKYKYKPYLLNDLPVEVHTTVSVTMDSYRDCHFE
jgi:protein TonB